MGFTNLKLSNLIGQFKLPWYNHRYTTRTEMVCGIHALVQGIWSSFAAATSF